MSDYEPEISEHIPDSEDDLENSDDDMVVLSEDQASVSSYDTESDDYGASARKRLNKSAGEAATNTNEERNSISSEPVKVKQKRPPRRNTGTSGHKGTRLNRGVQQQLPPISDIGEIFEDIAKKALDRGLGKVSDYLQGRPLRVATMCSGMESPLLALQLIEQSTFVNEAPHLSVLTLSNRSQQAEREAPFSGTCVQRRDCGLQAGIH